MKKKDTRREKPDEEAADAKVAVSAPGSSESETSWEMDDFSSEMADVVGPEEGVESKEAVDEAKVARERLQAALKNKGLSPRFALELVAGYDPEGIDESLVAAVKERALGYGLDFNDLPAEAQHELLVMSQGAAKGRSEKSKEAMEDAVETAIHRELFLRSTQKIDALGSGLDEKLGAEELRTRLRTVMESMNGLSKKISLEKEDDRDMWGVLFRQFQTVVDKKRGSGDPEAQKVFREVFEDFGDFIEDELVAYYMKANTAGVEQAVNEVYGRTKEEVEEIKNRNRADVVTEIDAMKDSPTITAEMLERLHAANNRGIVPKRSSRLREKTEVTFGERIGIAAADVKAEMEHLMERTNGLIDRDVATGMTKLRYEIEAAKLHNDLLDMHPFEDRNGSTALVFLELLMARKGYKPPAERQRGYYDNLRKVLGNNPVAVAVVGYEQYLIANKAGFYEGGVMPEESREKLREKLEKRRQAEDTEKKRKKRPPRAAA